MCHPLYGVLHLIPPAHYAVFAVVGQNGVDDVERVPEAWDNKGDIVIGNDVWIGYDAVIMAGVRIGDGAIIGTRAVVTKDIEPYSIVGGVPAKEIRKRFAPDIVAKLLELKWWDWPSEKIKNHIAAIQCGNIEELLKINGLKN